MTVCVNDLPEQCGALLQTEDVNFAVDEILGSPGFIKAPRMRHLLSFLVEQKLTGFDRDLSEYTIGVEVFRRDPASYDTGADPVVRVQVGRLRAKLLDYYATRRTAVSVEVSIPAGTYVPIIKAVKYALTEPKLGTLQVGPLRNLALETPSEAFVVGLYDELGSRLFEIVGAVSLQLHNSGGYTEPKTSTGAVTFRLEGNVRVEPDRVRTCMRLIEASSGNVAWQCLFDCSGILDIALQERLANEICSTVRPHLAAIHGHRPAP
jgi:TolB-like protein